MILRLPDDSNNSLLASTCGTLTSLAFTRCWNRRRHEVDLLTLSVCHVLQGHARCVLRILEMFAWSFMQKLRHIFCLGGYGAFCPAVVAGHAISMASLDRVAFCHSRVPELCSTCCSKVFRVLYLSLRPSYGRSVTASWQVSTSLTHTCAKCMG